MTPIKRTDAHGEGKIKRIFTGVTLEVFDRNSSKLQPAHFDFRSRAFHGKPNSLRRTVYGNDLAITEAA